MSVLKSDSVVISVGGSLRPQASLVELTTAVFPELPRLVVQVPLKKAADDCAVRADLTVSGPGFSSAGKVASVSESGTGSGLMQTVTAIPSALAVLLSATLESCEFEGAVQGAFPVLNAGGGNREAALEAAYFRPTKVATGVQFSAAEAIELVLASVGSNLTVDPTGLAISDRWELRGLKAVEAIQIVAASALGRALVLDGTVLRSRPINGDGGQVDLRSSLILSYSHDEDGSSTPASVVADLGPNTYVVTFHTGAGGGLISLTPPSGANPYRFWKIDPAFALPDGSTAGAASVLSSLPINLDSELLSFSSWIPPKIFFKDFQSTNWEDWSNRCGITVTGEGRFTVTGGDMAMAMGTKDQMAVTLALESGRRRTATRTGGPGQGASLRAVHGGHIRADAAAFKTEYSMPGPLATITDIVSQGDHEAIADALAADLLHDRSTVRLSVAGIVATPAVGDLVSTILLPLGRTKSVKGMVLSRSISQNPNPVTTFTIGRPSMSFQGVI